MRVDLKLVLMVALFVAKTLYLAEVRENTFETSNCPCIDVSLTLPGMQSCTPNEGSGEGAAEDFALGIGRRTAPSKHPDGVTGGLAELVPDGNGVARGQRYQGHDEGEEAFRRIARGESQQREGHPQNSKTATS